jgi:HlyD family secretion protein
LNPNLAEVIAYFIKEHVMKKYHISLTLAVLLASSLAISGCGSAKPAGGAKGPKAVPVTTTAVKKESVGGDLTLSGQVTSTLQTKVVSKISGKVAKVYVQTGDVVSVGQVLAEIDTTDLQSQLAQQQAALRTAEDNLAKVESDAQTGAITSQGSITQAKATMDMNKATLDQAQATYQQQLALYNSGAATKQSVDNAKDAVTNAQLKYDGSAQAYNSAIATFEATNPNGNPALQKSIKVAEDGVSAAQANLNVTQTQLNQAKILAPVAGVVASRDVEAGGYAGASQSVATIVQVNPVKVAVSIPESLITQIKVGSPVKVTIEALSNQTVDAQISRMSPVLDPNAKSYSAEIDIANTNGAIKPGMVVSATVGGLTPHDAIEIPADALVQTPDGAKVFTVESGTAHQHLLKLGAITSEKVEVVSGLKEGDVLVTAGQELLAEGSKVSDGGSSDAHGSTKTGSNSGGKSGNDGSNSKQDSQNKTK